MDYRALRLLACSLLLALLFLPSLGVAQLKPRTQPQPKSQAKSPQQTWDEFNRKNPGLVEEFGVLVGKLQQELQFPGLRGQTRLLPLLPEATLSYAAFPNYAEVTRQALQIFRQELKRSPALRNWWQSGDVASAGPKLEAALQDFADFSQFLGDEIAISGAMDSRDPSVLLIAEVRKPGLKAFLQRLLQEHAADTKTDIRILEPQELATAADSKSSNSLVVLLRPDLLAASPDLATLRRFNARLDQGSRDFASTPFGQRVLQAYQGGAGIIGAADLHAMIGKVPVTNPKDMLAVQNTGFSDVKYVVWEHKKVEGQPTSQAELSFIGPRRGIASWLAAPAPLESLDFVSPSAILAMSWVLKNPAQIFDDVQLLATAANPNGFAFVTQMEQGLHLSLRDDILGTLAGEFTIEFDSLTPPTPVWKAIFRLKDPARFLRSLDVVLASMNLVPEASRDGDDTYFSLRIPSGNKTTRIGYAFVDGHLIVASAPAMVTEAVRLHRTGGSLAKSRKLRDALPPGRPVGASALIYEDPLAVTSLQLQQVSPELAASFVQSAVSVPPLVICAYGEETAIREASSNAAADVGAVLIVAAAAIPNLLRSRTAANEASAVGALRTVNVAQVTYASMYPERGFAPTLEALGPDPRSPGASSVHHAALLDGTVGCADMWCSKNGYRFTISATCKGQNCSDFVGVATPLSPSSGTKNFCSTADGVIRFQMAPPLSTPPSPAACRAWEPLH